MRLSLNWLPKSRRRPAMQAPPQAPPEPLYGTPRPMTGFFATLSAENQARLRACTDDESFGDDEFLLNRQKELAL